jgi:hypothetical protein
MSLTKDTTFQEKKGVWVADVNLAPEEGDGEHGVLRRPTVNQDEERTFTT